MRGLRYIEYIWYLKILAGFLFIIGLASPSFSQDSLRYRVILIGDAGELTAEQDKALKHAAGNILPGKTSVLYLGDNIYPRGMGLPGDRDEKTTQQVLRSQYQPMRAKGAPVYFIPGNHDWDRMGTKGLEKIKRQWHFLDEQGDSLLKMLPRNGCPDPVEINLTDSLTIIVYDSEWWVFPFQKTSTESECECKTKADVLARLAELKEKNQHKMILLASHHPFSSYGIHGGRYTLKDHIFPLTAANKNLYIPLPVIGSLYPTLGTIFTNPEDIKHPLYKDMIKRVNEVFDSFPNLAHVSGHEHGLQLIKDKRVQIVSGGGSKRTPAKKGKHSLFADGRVGYVTADFLKGNSLRFTFYNYTRNGFSAVFTYALLFTPVPIDDPDSRVIRADSMVVQVHPSYDKPGKIHRFFFGENYRKEWATSTTLPVIRISELHGGLIPTQLGGGFQSKSLRLKDKQGKEWIIRSVEKSPEALLPPELKETFARDWVDDVTSAQHPFSALIVPPIANAAKVPHANPVIGVLSPDRNLGVYSRTFDKLVVLLEEREPLGKSDNTEEMEEELQQDNDNVLKSTEFLRARMLDMLLGDWDRHEDQWRWRDESKGKTKAYMGVPRDRDQVFHLTQGLIPRFASREYILPTLRNFGSSLSDPKWILYKTRFVNAYPEFQFTETEWLKHAEDFKKTITDSVLEAGLRRLPRSAYELRHDVLLRKLKARRDKLPAAMKDYYRFIQRKVDIKTSDKNEWVQISDKPGGDLNIRIIKINKDGKPEDELMNKTYDAALTKEIRLYVHNGNDSIVLNNKTSPIKIRIIGGKDVKTYNVLASRNKVKLYDKQNGSRYIGNVTRLKKHLADDSVNTVYSEVNLYNIRMPLTVVGLNLDDGFIFGTGFKFIKQGGFRKYPYASMHQLLASHSFSTNAYRIRYNAEWIDVMGKTDIVLLANANAPNNTLNFFGRGNETPFNKTGDYKTFYRTRYSTYHLNAAFRWNGNTQRSSFSIGPSFYYYRFDKEDNAGRFINNTSQIGSYDSVTIDKAKSHLGVALQFTNDRRNNKIFPQWGSYINIRVVAYEGMSDFAKSYAQIIPEIALYKNLNTKSTVIIAERVGGTVSIGQPAFYQSAYIGGHENLLGYRQYRFAGKYSFYNNLELRIKLADIASYIVPGQFGITGFWDVGRVWEKNDNSGKWHQGTGGGIYFAPASILALSFVMGHSTEGWYPYFSMGLRF
jgi:hypothetical protein